MMQSETLSTYPDPGFWTRTSLIQLGYGVWVNLSMVVPGLAFGFSAVAIPQLPKSNIKATISDQSWIASVLTLSAPLGCVISGYMIDKLGRRIMLVISHFPIAVGWFYTGMANSSLHIIIGRVITGFGMGMVVTVPRPYLTEISLPNMRGVIGSFPNLAMSIGIITQAALGSFYNWELICYVCALYSIILMVFNCFLPETPYYLLMKDTFESAEASLRKFRSKKHNISAEMDELMDFKMDNNIHRLTWREKLSAVFKRSACRPFILMMTYITITQLSGVSVMTTWTVEILERSKSTVDSYTGNIVLGITRLIFGVFTSILIFKVGRKPLALTSGLGVGVVCISLAVFFYYIEEQTVFPLICYIAYIATATLGHYTLPVLIMYELYPLQIRGILGGISTSFINFAIFGANKIYPSVTEAIGFANTILSFGIVSLLGSVFLYFYLPETKDLTLQEIEEYYNDRRSTLTSQRRIMSMHAISRQGLKRSDTASKSLIRITDKYKGVHDKTTTAANSNTDGTSSKNPDEKN